MRDFPHARALSEVSDLLKAQAAELDMNYLRHWATELQVEDLLQRALDAT